MLTGVDRQSGEKLDETNIIAQCITFLIAGHETTSGLLSFALYALVKNPQVLERGYEEVDRVLGADVNALPTYAQTHQLPYVSEILEETLRLWPTAPPSRAARTRTPSSAANIRSRRTGPSWCSPGRCAATQKIWGTGQLKASLHPSIIPSSRPV
jgi:cytochrome P450